YERLAGRPYATLVKCATALAECLASELGRPVPPTDVLIDAPPPHREIEFAIDVYFAKENVYRPFQQVSPVVDALAHKQFDDYVKQVRVFVAPELAVAIGGMTGFDALLEVATREVA
ncbi:MAG: metal-dependent phosphohydrolase, partial [Maioricimonas sp. JB049]